MILGKIVADAVFYTLAIIGYEIRKSMTDGRVDREELRLATSPNSSRSA